MVNVSSLTQMLQLGPGSDLMARRDQAGGCDGEVSPPRHPSGSAVLGFFPMHLTFLYVKQGRGSGHHFADLIQHSSLFGYASRRQREQTGREQIHGGRAAAAASSLNEQSTEQLPYATL